MWQRPAGANRGIDNAAKTCQGGGIKQCVKKEPGRVGGIKQCVMKEPGRIAGINQPVKTSQGESEGLQKGARKKKGLRRSAGAR
jgi:hypothetical protein